MAYLAPGGYAESLAQSTSASTTPADKVSVSPTLTSGKTYLIIASAQVNTSVTGATGLCNMQLWDATGSSQIDLRSLAAVDTTDYVALNACAVYTASATATRNFKIRFYRTGAAATVAIKNARITVIELGSNDQVATDASASRFLASYAAACTLTFTPPSTGDYLFIWHAHVNSGSYRAGYRFVAPDGTVVNEVVNTLASGSNVVGLWLANLAASSQTATIDLKADTDNASLAESFIVALRVSDLHAIYSAQSDADDGGTQTSYTTVRTVTASPLDTTARATVVLASWACSGNNNTLSTNAQLTEDGSQRVESIYETSTTFHPVIVAYKSTGDSSEVINIDRKSETSSLTTTIRYSAIAVLDFEPAPNLDGTAAGTGAATGTLLGTGALGATAPGAGAATGALGGTGALAATATGQGTGTGGVTGIGDLTAAAGGTSTLTGTFTGVGDLAGQADGVGAATGDLDGEGALAATADGTSTTGGELGGIGDLTSTAHGSSTATLDLGAEGALAGQADGIGAATGTLTGEGALSGQADGTSTVTGDFVNAASDNLDGTAAGTSTATGDLTGAGALSGVAAGNSQATAEFSGGALPETLDGVLARWQRHLTENPLAPYTVNFSGRAAGRSSARGALIGIQAPPAVPAPPRPPKPRRPAPAPRPAPEPRVVPFGGHAAPGRRAAVRGRVVATGALSGVAARRSATAFADLGAIGALAGTAAAGHATASITISGRYSETPEEQQILALLLASL